LIAMTPGSHSEHLAEVAYRGEVWTDGRGYATVNLPAPQPQPPLEYALQPLQADIEASVVSELAERRFTIRTNEPHVKVAWRITGRRPASLQPHPQLEEGTT
jgi:hypothetical protein